MLVVLVLLAAIVITLLVGVVVAARRLGAAVAALRSGVGAEVERLQPLLTELNEAGQLTAIELEQVQASVDTLSTRRRLQERGHSGDAEGYTA